MDRGPPIMQMIQGRWDMMSFKKDVFLSVINLVNLVTKIEKF